MIDKKDASDLVVLNNNSQQFLNKAKSLMTEKEYNDFSEIFKRFKDSLASYYNALLDSTLALQANTSAIKSVKIDPYIAGGLAQGAAGVGAGVYTAVSSAERNRQIDKQRVQTRIDVMKTGVARDSAEGVMLNYYQQLIDMIYRYDELISLHKKFLEEKQKADELENNRKQKENTEANIAVGIVVVVMAIIIFSGGSVFFAMLMGVVAMIVTAIIMASMKN